MGSKDEQHAWVEFVGEGSTSNSRCMDGFIITTTLRETAVSLNPPLVLRFDKCYIAAHVRSTNTNLPSYDSETLSAGEWRRAR